VHWYADFLVSADVLTKTHNQHPDKYIKFYDTLISLFRFILATEASNGYIPIERGPNLGSWENGISYAVDIMDDLQNWVSGWTGLNIFLFNKTLF
jgi:glucosylceramidase